jgi:hypothetical protein
MIDISVKRLIVVVTTICAVSLGSASAHAEISQKLRDGMKSSSPKVRIVAAASLAKLKEPGVREMLEGMLSDEDGTVRAAVVDALGKLGDPAAADRLEKLKDDDATVQDVLKRVVPALIALRVNIYIGKGEDFSGKGLGVALKTKTVKAIQEKLGAGYYIHEDASKKSFGASPIAVRSVSKPYVDGGNTLLDVKCELTLVDMPANILRAALSSTATVGVGGTKLSAKDEQELTSKDAIEACSGALAADFVSYVKERSRR